ncbi:hypothetical protein [Pseudovibrio sp. Tun.PSC04-5.I4]|uniref:hypothetical protein n=1 Tax=Pseudovibrio sp. Tun.PSC04-5.I4 TaxID=1798213 RepID=UPI000886CC70|nr:hypothetical protein [Pseudovibrio sp. Tun.PSC04-5.I4]SDR19266.1 hypothetical protein SAMN04515695_3306 [Pseudovibrio sp. Tun.PSC04-5.I4]
MRYVGWFLFLVAAGFLFWLAFIFGISFLQLNGLLLNDIIQIEATFKDFSWIEFVAAFGTVAAAYAAYRSADAAKRSAELGAATLSEMRLQRQSVQDIAEKQEEIELDKQKSIAQADRAMMSFALSGLCSYLTKAAQFYEHLLMKMRKNYNDPSIPTSISIHEIVLEIDFKADLPIREIQMLHAALSSNSDKLKEISAIFVKLQITHARLTGALNNQVEGFEASHTSTKLNISHKPISRLLSCLIGAEWKMTMQQKF